MAKVAAAKVAKGAAAKAAKKSILKKPTKQPVKKSKPAPGVVPSIDDLQAFQNWVPKGGLALKKEELFKQFRAKGTMTNEEVVNFKVAKYFTQAHVNKKNTRHNYKLEPHSFLVISTCFVVFCFLPFHVCVFFVFSCFHF